MPTTAKPASRLIAGTFVTQWVNNGDTSVYAVNSSEARLVRVKACLEVEGFEGVVIEPVLDESGIVGYSLNAKKLVIEEQSS